MTSTEVSTELPVFWWWEDQGRVRVIVVTSAALIMSGPLTKAQVTEMEQARRRDALGPEVFGDNPVVIPFSALKAIQYASEPHGLLFDFGTTTSQITAPANVASGIHQFLTHELCLSWTRPQAASQSDPRSALLTH